MRPASTSQRALPALADFRSVTRRMELVGERRRHPRLRRFRASSDRDRDDARRPARARRHRAHPRRHGAALELDAHGRARGRARAVAARRRRGRVPASGRNCRGMRQRVIGALGGRGAAAPTVDALIAALRRAGARRRPCRLHVQRRIRRRAAAFPRRAEFARDGLAARYPGGDARTTLALVALTDLPAVSAVRRAVSRAVRSRCASSNSATSIWCATARAAAAVSASA